MGETNTCSRLYPSSVFLMKFSCFNITNVLLMRSTEMQNCVTTSTFLNLDNRGG